MCGNSLSITEINKSCRKEIEGSPDKEKQVKFPLHIIPSYLLRGADLFVIKNGFLYTKDLLIYLNG